MTSLLFLACVLIIVGMAVGVIVGRILERWAHPPGADFDDGWQACLHALEWLYWEKI